jgi:hypothetical protein
MYVFKKKFQCIKLVKAIFGEIITKLFLCFIIKAIFRKYYDESNYGKIKTAD